VTLGCGDVDGPVAGAADVGVAALLDVLVGADLVRRRMRLGEVLTLEGLAELVIEAFRFEIALLLSHPFMEPEVRRDEEFGHFVPLLEKDRKDKRERGIP